MIFSVATALFQGLLTSLIPGASRNEYIYALADYAVVVSSDFEKGGTWAGTEEELRRERGRPVFVRTGTGVPKGNTELLSKGAKPLPANALTENLRDILCAAMAAPSAKAVSGGRTRRKIARANKKMPPEAAWRWSRDCGTTSLF